MSWTVIVGSAGNFLLGSALIATHADEWATGAWLWITAIASIYCAVKIRRINCEWNKTNGERKRQNGSLEKLDP
jgi:hypothetical protein